MKVAHTESNTIIVTTSNKHNPLNSTQIVSVSLQPCQAVTQTCKHRCEFSFSPMNGTVCLLVSLSYCCFPSFLSFYVCLVFTPFSLLLPSLPPALTCCSVNQTLVFLPGGMCADKTKALPSAGSCSGKVEVGRRRNPLLRALCKNPAH